MDDKCFLDVVSGLREWGKRGGIFVYGGTYAVEDHEGGLRESGIEVCFAGLERHVSLRAAKQGSE